MKKFIIKNAMALVALAIATVTLMSFNLAQPKQDELVWFEVENGVIQTDQIVPSGPAGDCQPTPLTTNICLAGFYESELTPSGEAPSENPNDTEHKAYRPTP